MALSGGDNRANKGVAESSAELRWGHAAVKWFSHEWLLGPENLSDLYFKRVADGWLYRSHICWWPFGLGPSTHYLVTERALRDRDWDWKSVALLVGPLLPLPLLLIGLHPLTDVRFLAFLAIMALYGQAVVSAFYWLKLRPALAGAVPTNQQIGYAERYRALAARMPTKVLIIATMLFAALAALQVHSFITAKTLDLIALAGVILFSATAAWFLAVLAVKRRLKQAQE